MNSSGRYCISSIIRYMKNKQFTDRIRHFFLVNRELGKESLAGKFQL